MLIDVSNVLQNFLVLVHKYFNAQYVQRTIRSIGSEGIRCSRVLEIASHASWLTLLCHLLLPDPCCCHRLCLFYRVESLYLLNSWCYTCTTAICWPDIRQLRYFNEAVLESVPTVALLALTWGYVAPCITWLSDLRLQNLRVRLSNRVLGSDHAVSLELCFLHVASSVVSIAYCWQVCAIWSESHTCDDQR